MTAIAIFVKTPGLSPVKTRLAASIGEEDAIEIYQQCAAAVLSAARVADIGPVYLALAESASVAVDYWQEAERTIQQGSGNLGQRMAHVMSILVDRHGSGLLLGADAPQLDSAQLQRAARWLESERPRCAIGPARDGGFWTVGSNHKVPLERWTRVAYSRPDTLEQFVQSLGNETEWLQLRTLTDLDTVTDLAPLSKELQRLRHPLPTQQSILKAILHFKDKSSSPET